MSNLTNLALLYNLSGGKSYEKCKYETISDTIHKFKDKKLKTRADKIVKNKTQAIAIALSQTHSQCERNKLEAKKLIDKVDRDLNDIKELNLTDIIETGDAIKLLLKESKSKRVYIFKKLLWDKIIKMEINGQKLDKNMWEEIKKIHNM